MFIAAALTAHAAAAHSPIDETAPYTVGERGTKLGRGPVTRARVVRGPKDAVSHDDGSGTLHALTLVPPEAGPVQEITILGARYQRQ